MRVGQKKQKLSSRAGAVDNSLTSSTFPLSGADALLNFQTCLKRPGQPMYNMTFRDKDCAESSGSPSNGPYPRNAPPQGDGAVHYMDT
eukprot:9497351-Pyramimonas_sp.AAC.2